MRNFTVSPHPSIIISEANCIKTTFHNAIRVGVLCKPKRVYRWQSVRDWSNLSLIDSFPFRSQFEFNLWFDSSAAEEISRAAATRNGAQINNATCSVASESELNFMLQLQLFIPLRSCIFTAFFLFYYCATRMKILPFVCPTTMIASSLECKQLANIDSLQSRGWLQSVARENSKPSTASLVGFGFSRSRPSALATSNTSYR